MSDPNGNVVVDQDTGVNEVVTFFAPVSGQYKISVRPFAAMPPVCTQGTVHIKVNNATGVGRITQDFMSSSSTPAGLSSPTRIRFR